MHGMRFFDCNHVSESSFWWGLIWSSIKIQALAFESRSEEKEEVSFQPDVSLSDFQVICCLGEGQFGTVELVSQRGRGEETAGAL